MRKQPITTNDVQPIQPEYVSPEKRRPAKGPIITTSNVAEIRAMNSANGDKAVSAPDESGTRRTTARRKKAE